LLDTEGRSGCCIGFFQLEGLIEGFAECLLTSQEWLVAYLSIPYPISECMGGFSTDLLFGQVDVGMVSQEIIGSQPVDMSHYYYLIKTNHFT
jgi:hypothetical protein